MVDRNRRDTLRGMLGAGVGAVAAYAATRPARAQDGKAPKEAVQYQDHPKEAQQCDHCAQWVAPNACKVVAGDISPKGWCIAYSPKEG